MKPAATYLSLVAGAMDTTTGVLVAVAPVAAPGWFGVAVPGGDGAAILMRWIGVFVAAVGSSYLWAIATSDAATRAQRLVGVWGATTIVRSGVGIFCAIAVALRQLEPVWLIVGCTDVAIAGVQAWGLRRGWLHA
jgi:hypothetical protein